MENLVTLLSTLVMATILVCVLLQPEKREIFETHALETEAANQWQTEDPLVVYQIHAKLQMHVTTQGH